MQEGCKLCWDLQQLHILWGEGASQYWGTRHETTWALSCSAEAGQLTDRQQINFCIGSVQKYYKIRKYCTGTEHRYMICIRWEGKVSNSRQWEEGQELAFFDSFLIINKLGTLHGRCWFKAKRHFLLLSSTSFLFYFSVSKNAAAQIRRDLTQVFDAHCCFIFIIAASQHL